MINVPAQEMVEVTEQKAFHVKKQVPSEVVQDSWELLPNPPCHWHEETHSHAGYTKGVEHKHQQP